MATQQQLNEAREALHLLVTGKSTVSVQRDGKVVWFQQTNRRDLENYIAQLEAQLGGGSQGRRRPAGVIA
ncbi:gpW family head-tail joining protein [Ectopseudomonas mendocina]|uniref:Phage tail protein n=1 Tax=Ectopseudomonas mendocina TaxID=300 RepID=A0A2R3QHM1_ECTME|nr:gpW family head-tail joining protein [Pseudomonas mendocina]AVO51222.1 phage tail protein [Pseudomonas mendocina]